MQLKPTELLEVLKNAREKEQPSTGAAAFGTPGRPEEGFSNEHGTAGADHAGDAGHGFDAEKRRVVTRLLADDSSPSQRSYLLELVDNPAGVRAVSPS